LFIVSAAGGFFGISLCSCCTYVYITHFDFGFVLQKRLKATEVTENTEKIEDRRQNTEDGRQKTEDRRQETKSRRGNPDPVGMGVLIVGLFSISRIRYLLDVYYTSKTVGCQVKSHTKRGA
jgi:hypothetical protein